MQQAFGMVPRWGGRTALIARWRQFIGLLYPIVRDIVVPVSVNVFRATMALGFDPRQDRIRVTWMELVI